MFGAGQDLIGCYLVGRWENGPVIRGMISASIAETEAYTGEDSPCPAVSCEN